MDPAQLQPGYKLDRYELLCPLAYGGMASVWLARFGGRLGFERLVVVKMILPQFSQDPRFQEMFLDEARIASRIEHPNVARILDVGEHESNYFIVMEWVDGDSLSKIMRAVEAKKQKVPPGIALRICADAAAGLHAAHELKDRDGKSLGVVHRDVSPQNILVSNTGSTMLIDFGVAKARDRVSQDTSAGQLKGKIRYMAPEQALGKQIDHRADVWAVGAMLYEMFAGHPPYDGANEVATLHKLTGGAPPPELPQSIPEVIRVVIERALAYDAENRFVTALEMNLACEGAMMEIGEPTTAATVAQYTGQLLADRKAARRKAVESALTSARNRDGNPAGASGAGSAAMPIPTPNPSAPLVSTQNFTPAPPSRELASSPSAPSQASSSYTSGNGNNYPLGYPEAPSAASNGTLGVASHEYPMPPPVDERARRKRYMSAAFLGVSLAAGVVGIVLIISTAVLKKDPNMAQAQAAGAKSGALATPPPPVAEPTPDPSPAPTTPPAQSANPTINAHATPSTSAPIQTTNAPAPHPPPTTAPAPAPAPTHKPPVTPTPVYTAPQKPPPPPPPSTPAKPKDRYGF
jgi:eukaryotic-like serine/threonine-protein kinase